MKTFESMSQAAEYIQETLCIEELPYYYGSYSYGQKANIRLVAMWKDNKVMVTSEKWTKKGEDNTLMNVSNKEIAKMAFFKLYFERKTNSAARLASALIGSNSITMGFGDIEWEIEEALIFCGAHPSIGKRNNSYFGFNGITKMNEGHYKHLKSLIYD